MVCTYVEFNVKAVLDVRNKKDILCTLWLNCVLVQILQLSVLPTINEKMLCKHLSARQQLSISNAHYIVRDISINKTQ